MTSPSSLRTSPNREVCPNSRAIIPSRALSIILISSPIGNAKKKNGTAEASQKSTPIQNENTIATTVMRLAVTFFWCSHTNKGCNNCWNLGFNL